jgi:hypothetical protein
MAVRLRQLEPVCLLAVMEALRIFLPIVDRNETKPIHLRWTKTLGYKNGCIT